MNNISSNNQIGQKAWILGKVLLVEDNQCTITQRMMKKRNEIGEEPVVTPRRGRWYRKLL